MTRPPNLSSATARAEATALLRELQTWLRGGAALGALLIGVSLLSTVLLPDLLGGAFGREGEVQAQIFPVLLRLLLAAAIVPPTLHLWRAYRAVHQLGDGDDAALISAAMGHQARFWSYVDVLLKFVQLVLLLAAAAFVCLLAFIRFSRPW